MTSPTQQIPKTARIGIIGAGPAGISAAYYLKKEGYQHITILDSSSRIAGKSGYYTVDSRKYDIGALMVGNNYTHIKELAQEYQCPLEKFQGRALDIDTRKIIHDDTDKIGIYHALIPHMNHYLGEKSVFEMASRPGHGEFSERELYAPISQYLKDRKMEYLRDAWGLAYTSAGYGYLSDDIPAAYFCKFIENSENTIRYFPNGFSELWEKMMKTIEIFPKKQLFTFMQLPKKDHHVQLNTKITSIDRSLRRNNPNHPILVTTENTETNFTQTLALDHVIIATNPRQTEKFLDVNPFEKSLLQEVVTFDFYTIIATVEGLSTKVGMTTIPKYCADKEFVGHITAFYCSYEGVPTYLFYAYGNKELNQEKVTEIFKEDLLKMGGELKEIHYNQKWDFFPHVSSLSMARGFYSKVENIQGQDGTFYVGGWLDFELTENCVSYSKDFVKRFFTLEGSQASKEIQHLPISAPIEIKPAATTNWGTILRLAAKRFPNKEAFTFVDSNMKVEMIVTYHELYRQARAVAYYLTEVAHHKAGDRIILCYAPGLRFLPILFGCMMVGVIAVPIAPPNLASAEKDIGRFTYLAKTTGAKLVFSDKNYMLYTKLYAAKSFLGLGDKIKWPEGLTWVESDSVISSKQLLEERLIEELSCESVAVLQFSSGSTGDPKGVMLTHKNLLHNVDLMQAEIGLNSDSTIAFWVPQFHDLGLIGGFLNTIRGGCKSVVMSPLTFLQKPESWLQMISNYQATFTAAPNFAYELAVRKTNLDKVNINLSSLRGAFNGAEPVRWTTLRAFAQKFGPVGFKLSMFKCLYGLAEHCAYTIGFRNLYDVPTVIDIDPDEIRAGHAKVRNNSQRPNNIVSTGVPNLAMQVEVRIVDLDTRQLCSPNTVGEVWMSSPSVGRGYYGKEEISEETFRAKLENKDHGNWIKDHGSFLRTGDLGFMYNGELFITGRQKDVIIINGKNHYPQDIELTVQESHESIRAGCVAAVHHSDPKTGTDSLIIIAEIRNYKEVTQDLLKEIINAISRKIPANHGLTCEQITLLKQQSIPKTTSGKIQRSRAKEMLMSGALDKKIVIKVGEIAKEPRSRPASGYFAKKPPTMQIPEIEQKISKQVQRVSKLAAKESVIDVNSNLLMTYGFDSITAVQLTACLKEEFGIEIAPALLLDLPSISELANHIFKQITQIQEPEDTEVSGPPISEIQKTITQQVHKVSKLASQIPLEQINISANLITEYGFDSLAAVQLTASLTQIFGIEIPPTLLYDVYTIADLAEHVQKQLKLRPSHKQQKSHQYRQDDVENEKPTAPILVPLAPATINNKMNPALFCIHPLLGNVATYISFARIIGSTRPVYGLNAPEDMEFDIVKLANRYITEIQEFQPSGPYFLCGYSYGGLVAWEMAKQLVASNERVGGLYLLDAPSPLSKNVRPSLGPDEQPHKVWAKEIDELLNDVDSQWMLQQKETNPTGLENLRTHIGKHIAAMYQYTDDITTLGAIQPFYVHYWRAKNYNVKTSKLLLDHPLFKSKSFGWERYQGRITVHNSVTGDHYSILKEENCGRLAREVNRNMPNANKRASMELKPLILENITMTSSKSNSPSSARSMHSNPISGATLIGSPQLLTNNSEIFNKKMKQKGIAGALNIQVPMYVSIGVSIALSYFMTQLMMRIQSVATA
ncbi:2517_t:CDS:2 [Ambispora leptoticha]|uniref:2517_t:CDS:1 n=1 Tax=Ambispora leptoticha TaxID=144679 RepID=A0A9N8WMG1_9GLOM|nr:2517_t:CDS:2 [Ambispora leptoticha]